MKKAFTKGLITGLTLQLAIGPVFFFILNLSLQRTYLDALLAILAVTIVDYIYISLAILGLGKLLEKENIKKVLTIISGIVLIIFGIYIIYGALSVINTNEVIQEKSSNFAGSFLSAFMLTISSPLTIVFWTSVFAARSIEFNLSKRELILFGFAAGLATFLFLSLAVSIASILGSSIPTIAVQIANVFVGGVLIVYGMLRLIKRNSSSET